jgi:hypothetical protein
LQTIAGKIKAFLLNEDCDVYLPQDWLTRTKPAGSRNREKQNFEIMKNEFRFLKPLQSFSLRMRADLCMTYSLRFRREYESGTCPVRIQFEVSDTVTGQIIARETGVSAQPMTSRNQETLIDEAVNNGRQLVLNQLYTYWIDQIKTGVSYFITVNLQNREYGSAELNCLTLALLNEMSESVENKASNDSLMAFIARVKPTQLARARTVRKAFRDRFNHHFRSIRMTNYGGIIGKWIRVEIVGH